MTTQNFNWLTIREAASQLGVSELTIRRRIKDRRLAHRLDNGKYYVSFDAPALTNPEPRARRASPVPDRPSDQSLLASPTNQVTGQVDGITGGGQLPGLHIDLDALLVEHRRMAEASGRVAVLEQQLRQLEERYSTLQEGAISLANRNGWLEGKLEEREQEIKLLTDSRVRLPWWKRLFAAKSDGE